MTCEVCNKQPLGRRDSPLACMVLQGDKSVNFSHHGREANERYYKCSECGHEWMRETGNCGEGWMP